MQYYDKTIIHSSANVPLPFLLSIVDKLARFDRRRKRSVTSFSVNNPPALMRAERIAANVGFYFK